MVLPLRPAPDAVYTSNTPVDQAKGVYYPNYRLAERLRNSKFDASDQNFTVNELQWIQYQLDNFETTVQVVESLKRLRVSPAYAKVHYFVCDKGGDCAAIDFLDGKA